MRGWAPTSSCSTARHAGTGGGNHVVVGGATPLDSSVPQRSPDLLKSLVILHWQQASEPVLFLFRPFYRADEPGAAHRRGAP